MSTQQAAQQTMSPQQPAGEVTIDFDSDEPLQICPLRKDGTGEDETCQACQ